MLVDTKTSSDWNVHTNPTATASSVGPQPDTPSAAAAAEEGAHVRLLSSSAYQQVRASATCRNQTSMNGF